MTLPVVGICSFSYRLNNVLLQGLGLAFPETKFQLDSLCVAEVSLPLVVVRPEMQTDFRVSFLAFDHGTGLRHLSPLVNHLPSAIICEISSSGHKVDERTVHAVDQTWAANSQNWQTLFSRL